ncbi:hypothetical protein O6H91_Y232500 [Diphasiastrum complanatum]|nr:hypothetical protein O6H91_Y232500 [Diphasiastrum complanatum]
MGAPKLAHAAVSASTRASPSVVKELCYGMALGLFGGALWKMHHVNEKRKMEEFYTALEKNEIKVEVVGLPISSVDTLLETSRGHDRRSV